MGPGWQDDDLGQLVCRRCVELVEFAANLYPPARTLLLFGNDFEALNNAAGGGGDHLVGEDSVALSPGGRWVRAVHAERVDGASVRLLHRQAQGVEDRCVAGRADSVGFLLHDLRPAQIRHVTRGGFGRSRRLVASGQGEGHGDGEDQAKREVHATIAFSFNAASRIRRALQV